MTIDVDPTEPAYAHAYARAEKIIEGEGLEEHLMWVALRRERIELLAQRLHSTEAARAAARMAEATARRKHAATTARWRVGDGHGDTMTVTVTQ